MLFANDISKLRKKISSKLNKAIPRVKKSEEEKLKKLQERFDKQKNLPYGKKAAKLAVVNLEKFIEKNKFGLYRGEAMLTLGNFYLEQKVDVETALQHYLKCKEFLQDAEKLETIKSFTIPQKALSVTSPPNSEKTFSGWNKNLVKVQIKPNMIINRNTCPWYIDSLKASCLKMISLCYFIQSNKEKAIHYIKSAIELEPYEKILLKADKPNSFSRLLNGYHKGWLRTPPEELNLFSDKLKTAVILGDFYYEIEDEEKCYTIRKNIFQKFYGNLTTKQEGSARCRLAEIMFRKGDKLEKIAKILKAFESGKFKASPAFPKAMIALGNIYYMKKHLKDNFVSYLSSAISCYEQAAKNAKGLDKQTALFYLGNAYRSNGEFKKAEKTYKTVLKLAPNSPYYKDLCIEYINLSKKHIREE